MPENVSISASSLSTFQSCPRKFAFRKLMRQRRVSTDGFHSAVGTAMHEALQHLMVNRDLEAALWVLICCYPWDIEHTAKNKDKSIEACISTLEAYVHSPEYQHEVMMIDVQGEMRPAIEVPILIRFHNVKFADVVRDVVYQGYVDAIMLNECGVPYVKDWKTNRNGSKDMTMNYIHDEQCMPYGLVLQLALGEDLEEFTVVYEDVHIDVGLPIIKPYEFVKTLGDVQAWLTDLSIEFMRMSLYAAQRSFPRRGKSCYSFYRACEFAVPCGLSDIDQMQHYMLQGLLDEDVTEDHVLDPWFEFSFDMGGVM